MSNGKMKVPSSHAWLETYVSGTWCLSSVRNWTSENRINLQYARRKTAIGNRTHRLESRHANWGRLDHMVRECAPDGG